VNDLTVSSAREISFEPRKSINFNLANTIQNTVELFDLKSDSHLRISVSHENGVPEALKGDPIAVKQIFLDLLNEIDAGESEELEIDINFSVRPLGKETYRADFDLRAGRPIRFIKDYVDDPSSTGSLAVKLIDTLGGSISVPVTETSNLKFWVALQKPADEIKMSDAALRIKELKSETKERKMLSDANILLVEDNPTNQKIVMISLAPSVKNIDTAINGKEALDLFGKSNYDLILMDVQLPVMDGITAVQKIRELEASTSKHTPVIAITANAMLGDKEKCLSAGMDEYLSKPFHPNQLLALIEKHITG
jgi:CheY-like chemotaxis protein